MNAASVPNRPVLRRLWGILVLAIALAVAPYAAPASTPLVQLGPITVADGTAVLAGTVGSQAAGTTLTVNGQPLAVDATGAFAGAVDLNGAGSISLALSSPAGDQQTVFTVPLTLAGLGGVIPAGVLDSIQQAGVSLLTPIVGNGQDPLTVAGSVLQGSQLAGLTANGQDILGALGQDGSFSVQLPGTTKVVTVTATDTHGTSETIVSGIAQKELAAGTTVAAASAVGIRIVKVRFYKQNALRKHLVRMVITVKDRRGLLIQGAKISVRSTKTGRLSHRPNVHLSGRKGRATFTLRLRQAALGKRLIIVTVAKTPRAKASKKSSVSLPRPKSTAARR
jgi:hypothetical protein